MRLLLVILSLASGQALAIPTSEPMGPRIEFEKHSNDFGDAFRGQTLAHDFKFTNAGKSPLMIVGTHSGCGCTAVEIDQNKKYSPGETGTIRVKFDTSDFSGKITKIVTVMTNEKVTPMRTLSIRADLQEEFIVSPPLADFGPIKPEDAPKKQIKMVAAEGKTFRVQKVRFNQTKLEVTHQEVGNNVEMTIGLLPGIAPGPLSETIYVRNNSKNLKEVTIFVTGTVLGNIQPSTNRLSFGSIDKQSPARVALDLKSKKEFKILGVETTLFLNGSALPKVADFVSLDFSEKTAVDQKIYVGLKNSSDQAGVVHGEMKLKTDDPNQKEISVEIRGFFE